MTWMQENNYVLPYINGKFYPLQKPERLFYLHNPCAPSDILAVSGWTKDITVQVTEGINANLKKYRSTTLAERMSLLEKFIQILKENAEELKEKMMLELGRSRFSVEEEWQLCLKFCEIVPHFCKENLKDHQETDGSQWIYVPVGKVLISPNISNPVYSLLTSTIPPLIAGNSVCVVPNISCLLSSSIISSSFHQASFPHCSIQFIFGDFDVFRRLLLTHTFDVISYTGNEENIEQVKKDASSSQNARLVLNGAGKNAVYVTDSVNMTNAINNILHGAFLDAGQRLEATGIIFVHKNSFEEFQNKIVDAVKRMPISVKEDPTRTDTHVMGPLCSSNAWERFLRFQGIAARESAETLRWGKPIENQKNGYFVSPGVHVVLPEKMITSVYATNPFFGPDICLVPVEDDEQVKTLLSSIPSARSFAIETQYPEIVSKFWRTNPIPSLHWNSPTTKLHPELPTLGRSSAGNGQITGMRFLFSTVYPQTLSGQHVNFHKELMITEK